MSLLVGESLSFLGALADDVAGEKLADTERIRRLSCELARLGGLHDKEIVELAVAATMRNVGAFRTASYEDRPAFAAQLCERIAGLPAAVADIVRWQDEHWDGTGHPDQLRWDAIPRASRFLRIAKTYTAHEDTDEARGLICQGSGRVFAPEASATFVDWYHSRRETSAADVATWDDTTKSICAFDVLALAAEEMDIFNNTRGRAANVVAEAPGLAERAKLAALLYPAYERAPWLFDHFSSLREIVATGT